MKALVIAGLVLCSLPTLACTIKIDSSKTSNGIKSDAEKLAKEILVEKGYKITYGGTFDYVIAINAKFDNFIHRYEHGQDPSDFRESSSEITLKKTSTSQRIYSNKLRDIGHSRNHKRALKKTKLLLKELPECSELNS